MQSVETAMSPGAAEAPSPHFTHQTNFDDEGHCRVVDRMVAIGLARRANGEATHWNDLKEFTPSQIAAHWPEACRRIDRHTFRDIHADPGSPERLASSPERGADDDEPDYSPRRLTEAVDLVASMIPTDIQIGAALRAGGIPD